MSRDWGWAVMGVGVVLAVTGAAMLMAFGGSPTFNLWSRFFIVVGAVATVLGTIGAFWSRGGSSIPVLGQIGLGLIGGLISFILFSPAFCVIGSHTPGPAIRCDSLGGIRIHPDRLDEAGLLSLAIPVVAFMAIFAFLGLSKFSHTRSARGE